MVLEDKSFRLRYVGARFNGGRLPVGVLSDLPAFRDLIVAYAKNEWRQLNISRKRIPKGFVKSISFDLIAIEEGSAVPHLSLRSTEAQWNLPGFSQELEDVVNKSYDDIVKLVDNAGYGSFPKSLAQEHIRALNRLGSGLHDGERIEFVGTTGQDGTVVYLDTHRRKEIITHVQETYQSSFEGTGVLVGVYSNERSRITVGTQEHGEIEIALDRDRVIEEFDGHINQRVQFSLKIELDNTDRFRSVIEVLDIGIVDEDLECLLEKSQARLNEIRDLQSGWHNGCGHSMHPTAIDTAVKFLSARPQLAGIYRIYPTEEGQVLFEFEREGWDFGIEFSANGTGQMEPTEFVEIGTEFLKEFDRRVEG